MDKKYLVFVENNKKTNLGEVTLKETDIDKLTKTGKNGLEELLGPSSLIKNHIWNTDSKDGFIAVYSGNLVKDDLLKYTFYNGLFDVCGKALICKFNDKYNMVPLNNNEVIFILNHILKLDEETDLDLINHDQIKKEINKLESSGLKDSKETKKK